MHVTPIKADAFCASITKALSHPPDIDGSTKRIRQLLNALPDGKLYISTEKSFVNFRTVIGGKKVYISKKSDLLYSLARRRYQSALLEILKLTDSRRKQDQVRRARLLAELQKFIRTCERGKLDIAKIVLSGAQYKWFTGGFRQKPIDKAKATRTAGGLYVRSNAEKDIINTYDAYAVPLHYEEQLVINVQHLVNRLFEDLVDSGFLSRNSHIGQLYDFRGSYVHWIVPAELESMNASGSIWKTYYPPRGTITIHVDIKTMFADSSVFLHEHEGMIERFLYRCHASERAAVLNLAGAVKKENFLETYERDIGTSEKRQKIIESRVLPRLWF